MLPLKLQTIPERQSLVQFLHETDIERGEQTGGNFLMAAVGGRRRRELRAVTFDLSGFTKCRLREAIGTEAV